MSTLDFSQYEDKNVSLLHFYHPILRALEDGKVIRKVVIIGLQVAGVSVLLGGVFLLIQSLKFSFQLPSAAGTLGGVIFSLLLATMLACVAQIHFYRAGSVRDLGDSPYTVTPIVSILFRTTGEVLATVYVFVGVGGCLFIWLSNISPARLLSSLPVPLPGQEGESTFLGGIGFLLWMILLAIFSLVILYFLAETFGVFVDIARNVQLLAPAVQRGETAAAALPTNPLPVKCPACGADLDADCKFCVFCGRPVGGNA
jgi:hypothetical protein